jgi:cobalt-zinc-cadmium efflux system membrane fusion protein
MDSFIRKFNLIIIVASLLISCKDKKADPATTGEVLPENIVEMRADQLKLAGVESGTIERRIVSSKLKVNGLVTVFPQNLASVCAPLGGFVKSTNLFQGSPVRKGQILAIIENPEFIEIQENYLKAKNNFEFAEGEYKRHTELYNNEVYSAMNLQEVTANYKNLKADVAALGQKLALIGINPADLSTENISRAIPIISPINGYISQVNVNIGMFVNPTDVLFKVINTTNLSIELTLFEKDINKIKAGQVLNFSLPNNELTQYKAKVTMAGKSISDDKTVKAYCSIEAQSTENILPGMYVNGWIETSNEMVDAVPIEAVVQFDEKDYIFVFEREKTEKGNLFTEYKILEVKKGVSDGKYVQVILPDGFDTKNSKIAVKGTYTLMSAKKNAGEMAC